MIYDIDELKKINKSLYKDQSILSSKELINIYKTVRHHRLPCVMSSCNDGFSIGMIIMNHNDFILPNIQREILLQITPDHLPYFRNPYGRMAFKKSPNNDVPRGFELKRIFSFFSRFTHNQDNKSLIKFYGLAESKGLGYYEY